MVTSVTSSTPSTVTSASSKSTASSATDAGQAAKQAAAKSLMASMSAGSGVDVNSLANALANAEIEPQKAIIQGRIDKSNATISGYAAIKYVLGNLQTAFADLKDQSDYSSITPSNSQPAAFGVTASSAATTGSHSVVINNIATAQRTLSTGFADTTSALNAGTGFTFSISVHGGTATTVTVPDGYTSPKDVVTAINSSNTGVKAQLVNLGGSTPWRIQLYGATGADNDFAISQSGGADYFQWSTLQSATDASLTVDGMAITSASNTVQDAIAGVTLDLYGATSGANGAMLNLNRDTSSIKTKIEALVTAYNETQTMLGVVSDPKSTVDTYGATLIGNSMVSNVRSQVRSMVTEDSSSASGRLTALRDMGVTLDRYGKLQIDSSKLDSALQGNFDDVIKMLSNNQENQSTFSQASGGVAGDAYKNLVTMLDPYRGQLSIQTDNQSKKITDYQKQLEDLNTKLQSILEKYIRQFSAMDNLVGQIKSTQAGIKSTFDAMTGTKD